MPKMFLVLPAICVLVATVLLNSAVAQVTSGDTYENRLKLAEEVMAADKSADEISELLKPVLDKIPVSKRAIFTEILQGEVESFRKVQITMLIQHLNYKELGYLVERNKDPMAQEVAKKMIQIQKSMVPHMMELMQRVMIKTQEKLGEDEEGPK
jgi:hypothetical protein